ncbi:MAG: T9SS type A sorting domain-containing protein, partial [Bacteroidales bacterium]|nr:T9SS type A sorting domain-containing protein [Bacteroidales bacterium]
VDLTPLQKGIYFMRFTNDNGVKLTHKLILK